MKKRRLRVLAGATLLALCIVGVTAAPADAAKRPTTNQRLQQLERRVTVRARALAALQRDTERLYRENAALIQNTLTLTQNYAALLNCVSRTPVKSWQGYLFDRSGTTITTTMLDWLTPFQPGGSIPPNTANTIHELGLTNSQNCLDLVTFSNPLTGAAATASRGATSATQEPAP